MIIIEQNFNNEKQNRITKKHKSIIIKANKKLNNKSQVQITKKFRKLMQKKKIYIYIQ